MDHWHGNGHGEGHLLVGERPHVFVVVADEAVAELVHGAQVGVLVAGWRAGRWRIAAICIQWIRYDRQAIGRDEWLAFCFFLSDLEADICESTWPTCCSMNWTHSNERAEVRDLSSKNRAAFHLPCQFPHLRVGWPPRSRGTRRPTEPKASAQRKSNGPSWSVANLCNMQMTRLRHLLRVPKISRTQFPSGNLRIFDKFWKFWKITQIIGSSVANLLF